MNFAEVRFWQILFTALAVVLLLRVLFVRWLPARLQSCDRIGLLLLGWLLLLAVSWITFIIFLVVALGTYVGLRYLLRFADRVQMRSLLILIPLQLAPLFYFKYAD